MVATIFTFYHKFKFFLFSHQHIRDSCPASTRVGVTGQIAVQQMDAVVVCGVGDSGNFRGHGLVLRLDHQTLGGIVRAGGGLFCQFLHTGQLFVDDAQGAVGSLNEIASLALRTPCCRAAISVRMSSRMAETGGIVRSGIDAQTRRKSRGKGFQIVVMRGQIVGHFRSHRIIIDIHTFLHECCMSRVARNADASLRATTFCLFNRRVRQKY